MEIAFQKTLGHLDQSVLTRLLNEDLLEILTQACADACQRYDDFYISGNRFEDSYINPPLTVLLRCNNHFGSKVQIDVFTETIHPAFNAVVNNVVSEVKHLNGTPHFDEREKAHVMPFAFHSLFGDNIKLLTVDYNHQET